MRLVGLLVVAALAVPAAAAAQDEPQVDQGKLYVTEAKACKALEKKGVGAFGDLDFLSMSFADGIQGYEFHCNFVSVKKVKGGSALIVEAFCEYPGEQYPDLLAITPYGEDSVQVVSLYDSALNAGSGEGSGGQSIYYRCDGLSELPRE